MPYLLFLKKWQNGNCHLLQIIGGTLWVKAGQMTTAAGVHVSWPISKVKMKLTFITTHRQNIYLLPKNIPLVELDTSLVKILTLRT